MQRVQLEVRLPAAEPAQLAVELAPPEWYRNPAAAATRPSWRDAAPGEAFDRRETTADGPLGSTVIELDLT